MNALRSYVTFNSVGSWNLWTNLFGFDEEETAGDIVFFWLFELFIAASTIYWAWYWAQYIPRINDIVLPLGIANYVDVSFMFNGTLPYVNAALISGLVVLGFLRVHRYIYMAAFLLLHFQFAARYVLGEIPHSSNVLGMATLGFGIAFVVFQAAAHRRKFVIGYNYFFIGLGYTLAGFCKLIGTGIFWIDGRHLWMWIHEKGIDSFAKFGVLEFNWMQEAALSSFSVATLFLTIGLLSELAAVLMWWRPLRTPVVFAVLGLHVGIYLVMGIMFWITFLILILLALPWARWIDAVLPDSLAQRIRERAESHAPTHPAGVERV
ncbi:MAG: hypothetical protein ACQETP_11955 [Bacteroidota bacterium]